MALPDSPHAVIPLVVREILAADSGLAAFFDRIAVVERRQLRGPIPCPSLLVVPGALTQVREVGGGMDCTYSLSILYVAPPETPWSPHLTALAAPTLNVSGSGSRTGVYRCRVTQADELGESEAGAEAVSASATSNKLVVTRPTLSVGATCWRVFLSDAGKTGLRWAATLAPAVASWEDDGTRRDELAPIPFLAEDKLDDAQAVLLANETLEYGGLRYATAAMECETTGDEVVPTRNLRLRELLVKVPTLVDPITKRIRTGAV